MTSSAATAAKIIRKELKVAGIKGRVRTSNYAGGSSINIDLVDATSTERHIAEEIGEKYAYNKGSNVDDSQIIERSGGPQASFVFVTVGYTEEKQAETLALLVAEGVLPASADLNDYDTYYEVGPDFHSAAQWVRKILF